MVWLQTHTQMCELHGRMWQWLTINNTARFYLGFIFWGEDEFAGSARKGCGHRPQCIGGSGTCPPPRKIWKFEPSEWLFWGILRKNEVIKINYDDYTLLFGMNQGELISWHNYCNQVILRFVCASWYSIYRHWNYSFICNFPPPPSRLNPDFMLIH